MLLDIYINREFYATYDNGNDREGMPKTSYNPNEIKAFIRKEISIGNLSPDLLIVPNRLRLEIRPH